jgi:hypothetical protein
MTISLSIKKKVTEKNDRGKDKDRGGKGQTFR